MKPYSKLRRADLEEAPIWEWAAEGADDVSEGIDESHVTSTCLKQIPKDSFRQLIVAAAIELKNGEVFPGIAEVITDSGIESIQPTTVFLLDRQLQIPGVETNRLLTRYTKSIDNHPVGWRLIAQFQGEAHVRSGAIKHGDMKEVMQMSIDALTALKAIRRL